MKYFIDTEFNEDDHTIVLISLAIVAEDGREFYVINSDAKQANCNQWVQANVWPNLYACSMRGVDHDQYVSPHAEIAGLVTSFIADDPSPEFWGYFADYDWVVFCWLWGAMVRLPAHFPMFCRDLKQEASRQGVKPNNLIQQSAYEHNALGDARWNFALYTALHPETP